MPDEKHQPDDETPMPAATWKPATGKDREKDQPNRASEEEPINPEQTGVAQPRRDAGTKEAADRERD